MAPRSRSREYDRHRSSYEYEAPREGRPSRRHRPRLRVPRNFTFISSWVKYSMFLFNFLFWLMGALLISVGLYAMFDKWSSGESFKFDNVFDVIFNLAFLLVIIGGIVFLVSFTGCIGALRENNCLLQFYSFFLLLFFLAEMALAGAGFIFPHKVSTFLEESLSDELIMSYRDDLDFQNLIDLVQQEFKCCGISSEGYRDWSKNEYFNCTTDPKDNPSAERCGVPFSCCLPQAMRVDGSGLINTMCGFAVQEDAHQSTMLLRLEQHFSAPAFQKNGRESISNKIYTNGCIQSIEEYVNSNMYTVGGVALGVALAQLFVIWLARSLESQIDNQRSLWFR